MAPKAKEKSKAKAKSKADPQQQAPDRRQQGGGGGEGGAATAIDLMSPEERACNAQVHDRVQQAKRAIIDHPVFLNIMDASPLDIHAGDDANTVGQIQPFSSQEFARAMTATGNYTCGFNLMGVDPHFSATPGIPLKPAAIDHLVSHYFSEPDFVPVTIQIAISRGGDPASLGKSGQLKSFTPEEMRMAIYLAIKRDIDNNVEDEKLLRWRRSLLSTTVKTCPQQCGRSSIGRSPIPESPIPDL